MFYDNAGFNDMYATAGVTRGVAGRGILATPNRSTFDGASDGTSATRTGGSLDPTLHAVGMV